MTHEALAERFSGRELCPVRVEPRLVQQSDRARNSLASIVRLRRDSAGGRGIRSVRVQTAPTTSSLEVGDAREVRPASAAIRPLRRTIRGVGCASRGGKLM